MDRLSEATTAAADTPRTGAAEPDPVDSQLAATPLAGIVFDVPDVLYDATRWRHWLVQLVSRLGVRVEYREFYRAWDAQLLDVHRGRREHAEALESFLLARGLSWAQVDEIEAASRIQRQSLELDVRPLPGVVRVLGELAGLGLSLAAWADAPHTAARLAERLERLVPQVRFDALLTSFDQECAQPSPECYRAALDALGLAASEVVYVGHDTAHLAGARAGGLQTVAFNFEPDARADHYLTRFEDLLSLAKAWCPGARRRACSAAPAQGRT
jgi:FMN phosphatase YigB (HAD superfamily)